MALSALADSAGPALVDSVWEAVLPVAVATEGDVEALRTFGTRGFFIALHEYEAPIRSQKLQEHSHSPGYTASDRLLACRRTRQFDRSVSERLLRI